MTFDPARLARLRPWMQRYVDDRKYPGCSVLIMQSGREILFDCVGMRDVQAGLPMTRDTLARIYSMTKPVVSVALMTLVEEGRFALADPVSAFLPEFAEVQALVPGAERIDQTMPARPPTLHELLLHVSGLSYPFNPGVLGAEMDARDILFRPDAAPLRDSVRDLAALPLAFQPGTRWEYSVGIDVIGRVIEVVSGQGLDHFLQDRIFEPLTMTQTGFRVPAEAGDRFAALYTPLAGDAMALNEAAEGDETLRRVDGPGGSPFEAPTCLSGGGGLIGTIDDYAAFANMLRAGGQAGTHRVLSPATLAFMMRNHLPGDIASMGPTSFAEQPMNGVGFGIGGSVALNPARAGTPGSVGDFSWGGMASTFFWVDPVHDLAVVFFTQLSPSSSYPSRAELKALIHAALI